MLIKYFFLALLWILWCSMHSIMISQRVTDCLKKRYVNLFRFYRLFFNLTAIITIILVLAYTYSIKTAPVFAWNGYFRIFQLLMLTAAGYLCFAGAKHYDLNSFLGLTQLKEKHTANNLMSESGKITISGIHTIIRHPWYTAAFLLIWARDMDISTLIVNIILSIYLVVGTMLEEKKLVKAMGVNYRDYQKRVDMFVPVKRILRKISGDQAERN